MKQIQTGQIRIFTFKEGLLSSVAHDLELELSDFQFNLMAVMCVRYSICYLFQFSALIVNRRLSTNTLSKSDREKRSSEQSIEKFCPPLAIPKPNCLESCETVCSEDSSLKWADRKCRRTGSD